MRALPSWCVFFWLVVSSLTAARVVSAEPRLLSPLVSGALPCWLAGSLPLPPWYETVEDAGRLRRTTFAADGRRIGSELWRRERDGCYRLVRHGGNKAVEARICCTQVDHNMECVTEVALSRRIGARVERLSSSITQPEGPCQLESARETVLRVRSVKQESCVAAVDVAEWTGEWRSAWRGSCELGDAVRGVVEYNELGGLSRQFDVRSETADGACALESTTTSVAGRTGNAGYTCCRGLSLGQSLPCDCSASTPAGHQRVAISLSESPRTQRVELSLDGRSAAWLEIVASRRLRGSGWTARWSNGETVRVVWR